MNDMTNPATNPAGPVQTAQTNEQAHREEEDRLRAAQQADDPARIRDEIRMTRARMDTTLTSLENRVSPTRIAQRSRNRLRTRIDGVRDAVMGSVPDTPDSASSSSQRSPGDVASDVADQIGQTPQTVTRRTRGNPLAAGTIAFGLGALIAAALPETDREQALAEDAADRVDLQQVRGEAEQAVEEVREPVRAEAEQGMQQVQQQAKSEASDVQDEAKSSQQRVVSDAKDAKRQAREHASDDG